MSENPQNREPFTNEAEPIPAEHRTNGSQQRNGRQGAADERPVPRLDLQALIAERNYPALAGLGLVALGILLVIESVLGVDISLWGLVLFGIGGWIMFDAWRDYDHAGRAWTENTRNRMLAGGLVFFVALMGMVDFDWWAIFLMGVGGWLGYDTWKQYDANERTLTQTLRYRAWAAALIGALGFFAFFNLGSAWPLILIAVGVAMLYRRYGNA